MTVGDALKRLLGATKIEDEFLLMIVNDDLDTVGASDAVRIWEKLNEELPEPEPAPKKEPKPKKVERVKLDPPEKEKPKKKLDDGKMLALRRAGWSYEKIADEMGCATQTVINHIKEKEDRG